MSESKWPGDKKSMEEIQNEMRAVSDLPGNEPSSESDVDIEETKQPSIHDDLACAANLPPEDVEKEKAQSNDHPPLNRKRPANNPPEDSNGGFAKWFKENNPLYLLSVLFMLLGLHLVSSDAKASKLGVEGLVAFFAVQNLYEIIMVGMALYLLKYKVQASHGKLLLVFVLLFLGDVTFYQVRISGLSVWYGNMATMVYMILAGVKLAAVIKVLDLTIYHWRIFYVFSSFAVIWIGPKIAYNVMDSVGKSSAAYFDATTILYLLWLFAGLIHLPMIIQNWKDNRTNEVVSHPLVGNETTFWRYLMIFPFVLMPIQLLVNVMADSSLAISKTTPVITLIIPWLIMAGFFAQTLWKKPLNEAIGTNNYDSILMGFALLMILATMKADAIPVTINLILTASFLLVTFITRGNLFNGAAIGLLGVYFTGRQLLQTASGVASYANTISKTAWAAILMVVSFLMLGLGFIISVGKNGTKKTASSGD